MYSYFLIIFSILFLLFSGCQSFSPYVTEVISQEKLGYKDSQPPIFLTLYYPYNQFFSFSTTRPLPDYACKSWPQERMIRDLQRMADAQFDVVICVVNTEIFSNSLQKEQLSTFFTLSKKFYPQLKICIMLDQTEKKQNSFFSFLNYLVEQNLFDQKNYFKISYPRTNQPKPLLLLSPSFSEVKATHPGLTILKTNGRNQQWILPTDLSFKKINAPKYYLIHSQDCKQVFIYPNLFQKTTQSWLNPNEQYAKFLGKGIAQSLIFKPQFIILSWNNYEDGLFIEPNQLFKDSLFQRVRLEISTLKKEFTMPAISENP